MACCTIKRWSGHDEQDRGWIRNGMIEVDGIAEACRMHLSVQQRCIPKDDRRGNCHRRPGEGMVADAREGPMEGKKEAGDSESREGGKEVAQGVCGNEKEQEKRAEQEGTGC
jgi:hypothetical protein